MRALLSVLIMALAACATPYQQRTEWTARGGYESEQLGPDLFSIRAAGNGFTSQQRTEDIVMMRAAEISREHGAAGFVFVSSEQRAERATAVGVGAGTIIVAPIIRPEQTSIVRLIRAPVPQELRAAFHDADEIIATVGPRLGVRSER